MYRISFVITNEFILFYYFLVALWAVVEVDSYNFIIHLHNATL